MKKYPFLCFLLVSNICFSQIDLSKGLVAYYPFNGDTRDASGNSNHGVGYNLTPASDNFGKPNSAFYFNGTSSYIRVPNSPSLNPTSGISICAWVKVSGFYLGPCRGTSILWKGNTDEDPPAYKLRIDENLYPGNSSCETSGSDTIHQFFYGQGQGGRANQGGLQDYKYPWIKQDRWYSVVYTYDGNTAKLYVDCKLEISRNIPGMSMTSPDDLFLGKATFNPLYPYWFNGVMDEIRIYDRAINQTEVMGYGGCCKIVTSKTNNPAPICAPGTINLKAPAITSGSDANLSFTYVTDSMGLNPLTTPDPSAVNVSGTYYIKGTGTGICTTVDPVTVTILEQPPQPIVTVIDNCDGTSTLSATGTGNLLWSNNATTPSITVTSAGTYTVTQTVGSCKSLAGSAIAAPKVTPSAPVITVVNNCDGTSTLSTTATGALLWSNNVTTPSIKVTAAGTYMVTQTVNGCKSLMGSGTAAPKKSLEISVSAPDIACGKTTGALTITAINGTSPYTYSIDGTAYQSLNVFNNLSAGNYTIKVKDAGGCTSDISAVIKLTGTEPVMKITNPARVCEPAVVDLTAGNIIAGSEAGITYNYYQDAATTILLSKATAVNKSGIYYIKGTNASGCFSVKPVMVSIVSKPQNTFAVSPNNSVCEKSTVQLNASGGTSYLWQPAAFLNNPNISNPVATPSSNIMYFVTIKDSTCNDSMVLSTKVTLLPLPSIKASKTNDIDCSQTFTQLNAIGGKSYLWQQGNDLNDSTISNPIAKPRKTTLYIVKGFDNYGCKNTDTVMVKVGFDNKIANYNMPTAFTPNNDGINDCFGLKYWGTVANLNFSIYNRFGERIFYTNDPSKCWDGIYKGRLQNVGAYVYVIKAVTACGEVNKKGTFVLMK